ncbi:MAG: hypothetical protein EPO28_08250 [Saprospiraceae bacterium]|nr:MAG: hypothetical protein EPO28_08250 [Saprospiraceae bacterium]
MKQKRTATARPSSETMVYSPQTKHLFTKGEQAFFEKADRNELFSPKYWKKQKERIGLLTREYFEANPGQPLKLVVIAILKKSFPDNIPATYLLEVVAHITQEWAELKSEAVQA